MDALPGDSLVGLLLDERYRIVSRLARGGMATVYSALDVRLDRVVALKVPHPALAADEGFLSRFIGEAKAAARLSHPNVVAVYDQGSAPVPPAAGGREADPSGQSEPDDAPAELAAVVPAGTARPARTVVYLVMEYVEGRTLRDWLSEAGPRSAADTLLVLEGIAAALGAAHSAGLVHRDVKPENVLLADDGRVKVADFGLARAVDAKGTNAEGPLLGTACYVAPEQVSGGVAHPPSDVYSAGIVAYEMLTGSAPYTGDNALQVAHRHVEEDVPLPSSVVGHVPPTVDALVQAATRRDPAARPQDGTALLGMVAHARLSLRGATSMTPRPPAGVSGASQTGPSHTTVLSPLPGAGTGPGAPRVPVPSQHTVAIPVHPGAGGARPGVAPAPSAPPPAGAPATPRDWRPPRGRWALAGVLGAAAALAALVWALIAGPFAYTTTPALVGKTERAATEAARQAGLNVRVAERRYDETTPDGEVLATDPPAGASVSKNGTVALVLSRGKERYDVPELRGRTLRQARKALEDQTLTLGEQGFEYDDDIPEGAVISSRPGAGTSVKPGTAVSVRVSRGVPPIVVPSVVGQTAETAEAILRGQRLQVARETRNDPAAPAGAVIGQSPDAGTRVSPNTTVTLVVSEGPQMVPVPDVGGRSIEEAERMLREAGFDVRASGLRLFNSVRDTTPPAGTFAPRGSVVILHTQ